MSQKVTGRVFKVYSKEFPPNKGKKAITWYSIKLEDDKLYYRCKAHNPGDITGKTVEFQADGFDAAQASVDVKTLKVVDNTPTESATSNGGAAVVGSSRDAAIQYQSARKDALVMADLVLRNGGVKLPAKESAKEGAIEALVDSYTAQYFLDITTLGAVARTNGTTDGDEQPEKDVGEDE